MNAQMQDEVTIKELFERLVVLETKFDQTRVENKETARKFTWWAIIIAIFELLNLWVHSLSIWGH